LRKEEVPVYVVNLALKLGATDASANIIEDDRTMIRFSNNEITISKASKEVLLGLFVMIEKHRATTTVPLSSLPNIKKAAKNLVRAAQTTPPADVYAPLPSGPFQYDPKLLGASKLPLSPDKLTGYVRDAVDGALEEGAEKVAGTLVATKTRSTLATSGQVSVTQEKSGLEMSIRAFTSDIASGHSVSVSSGQEEFSPSQAGREAGRIAKAASEPEQGRPGKFTALLGPLVFADLVSQVGRLSSAFQVLVGRSFLADKLGSEVSCAKFTLVDDPTDEGSYGARAFDDEGVPTRRNAIIDRGVLKTYLHNSATAKRFGVETTANAGLIMPHPWNLTVVAGDRSFGQLLAEIDEGIYVTNDWYLRYQNYRTGDFSTIPRDGMFLIRNGEIKTSIRELRISDNMLRIFRSITGLSDSRQWVKWWEVAVPTLTPYAVVEDMIFTKSGM